MARKLELWSNNIFTFSRIIKRKEYFFANICLLCVGVSVHYLIRYSISLPDLGIVRYAILKNILAVIYLVLFMPFIVGRLRDINASIWWPMLYWISLPVTDLNFLLIQEVMSIQVNFATLPLILEIALIMVNLVVISSAILSIVLLVKPSSHNKKIKATS